MDDKIKGAIVGSAIGDALGYADGSVEFNSSISPNNPAVFRDTLPRRYSDDTQMLREVAEGLIRARPSSDSAPEIARAAEEIAEGFVSWAQYPVGGHRAPGGACLHGCGQLARGVPWDQSGKPNGGGCGAAMRSAPYGLWFPGRPALASEIAAQHALMTHDSPMAQASAAAIAAGCAVAVVSEDPMEVARHYCLWADHWDEETGAMCAQALLAVDGPEEYRRGATFILDHWRGWAGHEAVAASLYCFLRHPHSFEDAVLLAVNSPGDSDSLGAITGALSGAFLGFDALPKTWVDAVERTGELQRLAFRFSKAMDGIEANHGAAETSG